MNDALRHRTHRAHASTALIAEHIGADAKMFGYLMGKEVHAVEKVMQNVERPFTAIMGGSKVSTKIEIIENLLGKVDNLNPHRWHDLHLLESERRYHRHLYLRRG